MRYLLALLALSLPAFGSTYACVNSSADPTALNAAMAAGGTVVLTVTGPTCLLGPTSLQIPSNVSLLASGSVRMNYTGTGVLGFINGNNVTINGFVLNGGGLLTTQSSTSTPQSNVAITNNTFQNITANGANTAGLASSGYWSHFTITGNAFNNISTVPIGSVTSGTNVENGVGGLNCSWIGGTNNCFGVGVNNENGMDNTLIEHNTFNFELGDAIRIVYNWTSSTGTTYHVAANNSISYNTYINLHRMAIESQGVSANPSSCIGSCIFPASAVSNLKMTANFAYQFVAPYVETFFLSIPIGAPDPIVYNNTGVSSGAGSYGYCFENAFTSVTMRGNVCSSATGGHWAVAFQTGSSSPGPILYQNNWFAGSGQTNFGQEGSCSSCWTQQFNQINSAPDNASAPQTSNITTGSSTVTPSGTSATLNAWATGEISILNTQFKLDGTLVTTQEISNVNTNFTTDRHWLYANTFTGLSSGSHTVQAVATDLTGATSTTSQTFTIAGGSPGTSFAPTSQNFGSVTQSTTSSPLTTVLTNNGSATLTISGITLTGTNAANFTLTGAGTCGATLAASASCNIVTTFTPSALGSRTASISVADNATGSPQTVPLSGTGTGTTEVNNISFNTISHGSASINFTTLTASTALRMRLTIAPTACSGGSGGSIINGVQATYRATFNQFPLTGLAPAITYNVCPEVAKAASPTVFSTGATASLTTLPLPAVHPAKPIKPLKFDTRVPAAVGSYAQGAVLPDCSNLGSLYVTAVGLQSTNGTVISYPAGVNCLLTAGSPYTFQQHTPDIHDWLPTDVDLATSSITWTSHGFAENELVSFGRSYATVVTYPAVASCNVGSGSIFLGGIQSGQRYPVHVVDANHIRPYCLDGTTLMTLTDQGSVQAGQTFYAVAYRQFLNTTDNEMQWARRLPSGAATPWIILRSAATDAQLTPEHVQITAAHEPLMAKLIDPVGNVRSGIDYTAGMIFFGNQDANVEIPIGNIRLGPGIEVTTEDYGTTAHTNDPWFYQTVLVTYPWNSGIIFDRIWYKLLDGANRGLVDMVWNGSNVAAVDSLWTGLTYFHANNSDSMHVTKSSNTIAAVSAGTAFTGPQDFALSAYTITISGSGSGRIFVYLDMANSFKLTAAVPSGITVTSSAPIVTTAALGGGGGSCNVSDHWPHAGVHGEVSGHELACIDVVSGAITTVTDGNPRDSDKNGEGNSHMLGGIGPGPYMMVGNFSEGAGITWHWDDSGDSHFRGNYTLSRNYFNSALKYLTTNPAANGKRYFHRQGVEWKAGVGIDMRGNHFNGGWIEDNNNSPFIAMTVTPSNSGNGAPPMSDIDIHENIFEHGGAMLEGPLVYCTGASLPCSPPIGRVNVHGNVAYDINGYTYTANNPNTSSGNNTPANGWLSALVAIEDFVFDHNTILPTAGHFPWMFSIDHFPQEGFTVTNNILWYTLSPGVSVVFGPGNQTFCTSLGTRAFMDCAFTSGPGVPSYTFGNNLIAGGWLDSSVPSGQNSSAAMTTAFGGLGNNYFTSGGTVPATMAALKWLNSDFTSPSFDLHLLDASPIKAGNNTPDHSADVGADINKLYAALGRLTVQGVPDRYNGTTSASVGYTPADSGVCYVDISKTDPEAVTGRQRFNDSGGSRNRVTAMAGLTTNTFYYGVVRCSGNERESQKPFTFKTN